MKTILYLSAWSAPILAGAVDFEKPYRLKSGEDLVKTESPGYAAPCLHDMDGDGNKDLLVGQFANGKVKVYPGKAAGSFGPGQWLDIGGQRFSFSPDQASKAKAAIIPGVW